MKPLGYNRPLYLLSLDRRSSFASELFGWHGALTAEQDVEIAAAKQIVYEGFKAAVAAGVEKERAGILVDEQFGAAILRDAVASGFTTACPVEKGGQEEFDFEYGEDFAAHIEAFQPTFCKALVRYYSEGDAALNERQAVQLKRLSDYLHSQSQSRLMLELFVPQKTSQISGRNGDRHGAGVDVRPRLTVQAIEQLQHAGVEPDVWKIEGLELREDCEAIVAAAQRQDRDDVGCVFGVRGADDHQVRESLRMAASVRGFIGFAVEQAAFWAPLVNLRAQNISRETAVAEIRCRYWEFAGVFEDARTP